MMIPKDLLEHLEKGDRTMHHLTKKPELNFAFNFEGPSVFWEAYRDQMLGQIQNATNHVWQSGAGQLGTQTITTGGIIPWR